MASLQVANWGAAYARLIGSYSFLNRLSEGASFEDAENSAVENPLNPWLRRKLRPLPPPPPPLPPYAYAWPPWSLRLPKPPNSGRVNQPLVPPNPNSWEVNQPLVPPNPNSWVNRCLTGLSSAISTANEALNNAGNAINTAVNLFDSLRSLSAGTSDTSSEGIYLSELILHMTSLNLKGAWSSVSEGWSKFMNNIGRMLIDLKIPGPDGFLGNYAIQSI